MIAGKPITLPSTVAVSRAAGQKSSQFTSGCATIEVRSAIAGLVARLPPHEPYM